MPTQRANGIQVMKTCEALSEIGIDVTLAHTLRRQTRDMRGVDPFDFYAIQKPFRIRSIPYLDLMPIRRYIPRNIFRVGQTLSNISFGAVAATWARLGKYDICYTRHWATAWWLSRFHVPTVFEVHQIDSAEFSKRAVRTITRLSRGSSLPLIVTISHALKDELVSRGAPEDKILVLPDAVDLRPYSESLSITEARRQIGLSPDDHHAIYTGGFFKGKGADVLAESSRHMQGITSVLVGGTGEDRSRVETLIQEKSLPDVTLIDPVKPPEVPLWQQAADVLVLPQLDLESQSPLKLYEYMAARRPIVASDVAPIREVVTHEETALLVPPGDPEALASAVQRLIKDKDLAERISRAAYEQVGAWTWEKRVAKLVDALDAQK
jgi:glycosyltransferase involved in cell wall biosynthesis